MNEKESAENARMLAAIDASIAHWERMHGMDMFEMAVQMYLKKDERHIPSGSCCALCEEYKLRGCAGCPVRLFTGKQFCHDTPYGDAAEVFFKIINGIGQFIRENIADKRLLDEYRQNGWHAAGWSLFKRTLENLTEEQRAAISQKFGAHYEQWKALSREEIEFLKRLRD